jgi:type-F conjugative transfer system pilin assembly thiol-disulfide isomerase TrbB
MKRMFKLPLVLVLVFSGLSPYAAQATWLGQMIETKAHHASNVDYLRSVKRDNKGFFGTHGLVFFYGSTCPHCKQFAPILKNWANQHQAEVLPLAFDNQPLPEFPTFLPATTDWVNSAFQGREINYPALFIVNLKTHALYPVSFGAITESELATRMETLIPKIRAYEAEVRS